MELKQLHYFLTVAEHLSFSRAAEALYISQPALSYQIAELERELGAPLFIRDRREVSLSPAGAALVPLARDTLEASRRILLQAQRGFPPEESHRLLRIGFDDTEDHFDILGETECIARFQKKNPQLRLEMEQGSFRACTEKLLAGELDLAVLVMRHNEHLPGPLTGRRVLEDRLALLVPEDDQVTDYRQALEKYSLMMVERKPRGRSRLLRALEDLGVVPNLISVDSFPAAFVYLQSGRGCLHFPEHYARVHRYHGIKTVPIPSPSLELLHVVAWNKRTQNPDVEELVAEFPDLKALET